ncbi:MAG: dTDP-4-dehydrorhamnose 3,5-epimerase [Bacteriovoracaceae bacterium]
MGIKLKVLFEKLKIIPNSKGDIYHALRSDSPSFTQFGEAYFAHIKHGETKAWKLHKEGTCNLIVPEGDVKFVVVTPDLKFEEFIIGKNNYGRLTIPPNTWFGFHGVGTGTNIVLNILNILHRSDESLTKDLFEFDYKW